MNIIVSFLPSTCLWAPLIMVSRCHFVCIFWSSLSMYLHCVGHIYTWMIFLKYFTTFLNLLLIAFFCRNIPLVWTQDYFFSKISVCRSLKSFLGGTRVLAPHGGGRTFLLYKLFWSKELNCHFRQKRYRCHFRF